MFNFSTKQINIILVIIFILIYPRYIFPQDVNWFGKSTINSVVLLQKKDKGKYINHGVGILFSLSDYERSLVVTCEHLLRGDEIYVVIDADSSFIEDKNKQGENELRIRKSIWEIDNYRLRLKVNLIKDSTYVTHSTKSLDSLDIAAFPIDLFTYIASSNGSKIDYTETTFIGENYFGNKEMVRLGEDVYFIGFPFGIGTKEVLEPLLRSGTIAWVSKNSKEYLIDAFSYGGNSGSPLFTKMNPDSNNRLKPYLIGMILGHLETKTDSVNVGLARCVYIQDILEVIEMAKGLK